MKFKKFVDKVLDFVSAKSCYSCQKEGFYFCPICIQSLQKFSPICHQCKKYSAHFKIHQTCRSYLGSPFYDAVITLFHYKDYPMKKLLHDGKYYKVKTIYEDFIDSLSQKLEENRDLSKKEEYLIVYPPMHLFRRWYRGYNQSEYLGQLLAKRLGIETFPKLLKKTKHTVHQSHLSKIEREQNLRTAFSLNKKYIPQLQGKKCIIVDDVISTGSTLSECAKILKENGGKEVIGLVIASD